MPYRAASYLLILLLVGGTLFLMFAYGPLRRSFASPVMVRPVSSAIEIGALWEASGVKGRIAVHFTRHLNAESSFQDTEGVKFAELAMRHGIVRTIYHVVPDSAWPVVSANLAPSNSARVTSEGFALVFPAGRVHVLPLSKFKPGKEVALVVLEPLVWDQAERDKIAAMVVTGALKTDLLAIIRGTMADVERFKALLPVGGK